MIDSIPCLPNLSSFLIAPRKPWDELPSLPRTNFASSVDYKRWTAEPTAQTCAFSTVEGIDPTRRVTSDNEPAKIYGVVADYDAMFSDEEVSRFVAETLEGDFPVSYISRSFNGGIHALWLFDEPVLVSGSTICRKMFRRALKEMGLNMLARGLDADAITDYSKYYQHGWDWAKVSAKRMSKSIVSKWIFEACGEADFREFGVEIPLERIEEEVAKRFPARWKGAFTEGTRGVRFWDSGADNPTGAVVRKTGMQCFTGDRPFVSWSEIFGGSFVATFQTEKLGDALDSVWFDGKNYWVRSDNGRIQPYDKSNVQLFFKVKHGFNGVKGKTETASEIERALWTVASEKRVEGAMPFPFCKDTVVTMDGQAYINIAQHLHVCKPDTTARTWGDGFPWLASYLDTMFGPDALPYFVAWLTHFYVGALNGKPRRGHALFLCGGVNAGKTLLTNRVIGGLVGGFISPTSFMLGKTEFNDAMFDKGLWCIDDAVASGGGSLHAVYSANVKATVANPTFTYHPKFCKPLKITWSGRLAVTMNLDGDSIRMLPDLDANTRDKVHIYHVHPHGQPFPDTVESIIAEELPYLASFLVNTPIPRALLTDTRLGVSPFIDPSVEHLAVANSGSGHLIEVIDLWRKTHFTSRSASEWRGSASELLVQLSSMPGGTILLKDIGTRNLAWGLRSATSQGLSWISRDNDQWVVLKDASAPAKRTTIELGND